MASLIQSIIGHEEQKQLLLGKAKDQTLPSSFIFYGSEGIGKKDIVRGLLQEINCQRGLEACGSCSHCIRALEPKNDIVFEINLDKKKTISVEQVRELHKFVSLKTVHQARFVIIDPADKLSTAASNALLKVLEEPPPRTHFFLMTSRLSSLLPTIRSRSHILRFQKLTRQQLTQVEGMSETSVSWAGGRLDYAKLLTEEEAIHYLNESLKLFYSLLCLEPQDWKKIAPWFFNGEEWKNFSFHIWACALEKRLAGESENLEWIPEDSERVAFIFDQVSDFESDLTRNVDKLLAMENFYYGLRKSREGSVWN